MTPIRPVTVLSRPPRILWAVWLCAGIALGIGIRDGVQRAAVAGSVVDPRMESACKFPQREGEFLAVTVLNDQLKCWRYK